MPDRWRESVIKEKLDDQECRNYRGMKLLSHTVKITERIMDARVGGGVQRKVWIHTWKGNNKPGVHIETDGREV